MSEDLIKRSDAIKALHKHFSSGFDCDRWWNSTTVLFALNSVPSADRPQGEWIDRSDGGRILNPWWENYECNRCGYYGSGTWNFCPNCGADMRERESE